MSERISNYNLPESLMTSMRIDKWLWAARFFKTRALASKACDLGRIRTREIEAKPAREVHVADMLHIKTEGGETYRWKGENVSTAEVLTALTASRGVLDGAVYGVTVPGSDGRAGTAALVLNADFDLAAFRAEIALRLPAYARPVFLRILTTLESTATFKPRKQDLVAAGFDPARVSDPLYFDDARAAAYVPLDGALYAKIAAAALRI